jgi:hypothetical protein
LQHGVFPKGCIPLPREKAQGGLGEWQIENKAGA